MQYLSLSEAAKRLGKSRQWLWVLIQMKRLNAEKIGNQYAIDSYEVEQLRKTLDTSISNSHQGN